MTDRFVRGNRGDRLRPGLLHPRYHVLRQLAAAMSELAQQLPRGETILDFGCAGAPYEQLFAPSFARYMRADLPGNPRATLEIDPTGMVPLPGASCDAVLSTQVLEHVSDPGRYLAEARRLLRDAGHLVLSTHGSWPYHPDPRDLWRWTREGLGVELARAGFEVIEQRSILGPTASALQLLQDALADRIPLPTRVARRMLAVVVQPLIGIAELARRDPRTADAAVYVVLARAVPA